MDKYFYRRYEVAISCNQIIAYAIKLLGKDLKFSYNAYRCWVKRFLKRHNLSIRRVSHLGQKINGLFLDLIINFLTGCINETKIFDDISCLINEDEIPIFLESPSKDTIDIKGKKIDIITFGKDKVKFTAVLSISASGAKLPPLFICKGKPGKRKEDQLNYLEDIKSKKVFIKCHNNAWCTTELFKH